MKQEYKASNGEICDKFKSELYGLNFLIEQQEQTISILNSMNLQRPEYEYGIRKGGNHNVDF